jgi:hypothetical protein
MRAAVCVCVCVCVCRQQLLPILQEEDAAAERECIGLDLDTVVFPGRELGRDMSVDVPNLLRRGAALASYYTTLAGRGTCAQHPRTREMLQQLFGLALQAETRAAALTRLGTGTLTYFPRIDDTAIDGMLPRSTEDLVAKSSSETLPVPVWTTPRPGSSMAVL